MPDQAKTLVISQEDTKKVVQAVGLDTIMSEMIQRLRYAFATFDKAKVVIPTRSGFQYTEPHTGLIEWMPIMQRGGRATVKMVGYHPTNPERQNLPTILSTVSAYDTVSGRLLGLADATFLTALRTGAASAIASEVMASPNSSVIGLIGAGAQAMTQLHALSRMFDIKKVYVYDANPTVSDSFLERVSFMGLNLTAVSPGNIGRLVQKADIISTTTSVGVGEGPVFSDQVTKPHLHINAVGSDFPGKVELPFSLLKRSIVCPDFREQAMQEGECQQLDQGEIGPDLVELIQNPTPYANLKQQQTVFDSTGWALEDQVAMDMLLDYATSLGLGTAMQIESSCQDPYNPYQFVVGAHTATDTNGSYY